MGKAIEDMKREARLEAARKVKYFHFAIRMQSHLRMVVIRNRFRRKRRQQKAAEMIQSQWRARGARAHLRHLQWNASRIKEMERLALLLQRRFRGITARRTFERYVLREEAALIIQCQIRTWAARRKLVGLRWARRSEREIAQVRYD